MSARRKVPVYVYRYVVTASDIPEVPVGKLLVDKGNQRVRFWDTWDRKTGEERGFVGKRGPRCCSECYVHHRVCRDYDHGGPHGEDAPYTPWDGTP